MGAAYPVDNQDQWPRHHDQPTKSDINSDRPRINEDENSQIAYTPTKQVMALRKGTATAAMARTNRVERSAITPFSVLNMKVSMNET